MNQKQAKRIRNQVFSETIGMPYRLYCRKIWEEQRRAKLHRTCSRYYIKKAKREFKKCH